MPHPVLDQAISPLRQTTLSIITMPDSQLWNADFGKLPRVPDARFR
ncbi:hypothetical protein [Aminobacter carboxidus]|uniref:Uncharacterized protein n=1 Tax=Aminobacter carboxidus TaxID=376165 RepID=A0ABR9GXK8_9HYPH|nr:hypothetical protein [Aminobacter carboxidus]MBE1208350.1 hypothetical protein [Aminobacter carboxidus]